ncbi:FAD-binding oxidoreductase [Acidovorax sp.]|uniref:FAD-binding oxidoreductase n=1 Tax=Acidovorax sp. TaxID=1872122 RepID=UPI0026047E12|nr:FAD-binding oxidoreductase [Acidovorax sp.]
MTDTELLHRIVRHCGEACVVAPTETAQRTLNLRGEAFSAVPLLRPSSTEEVVFIVKLARQAGRALVPVGGATGLVDALKTTGEGQWYLSLERMRQIERLDADSRLAVVQAGVVLQTLQDAAAAQGLLFAVDLGARGSATVGGLIATNAGGERVLRFGMMREQVLGLEVVTADGQVLDLMAEVLKNNAGYDLKQLFIGSEGTLGIVTRAVVRLRSAFESHDAAWLALPDLERLPAVLTRLERGLGGTLSAFELMWPEFVTAMCGAADSPHRCPVGIEAAGHVLIESEGGHAADDHARFETVLGALLEEGLIADAMIAQSDADRQALWALRNDIPRLARHMFPPVAFDVSVAIGQMAGVVDELRATLTSRWPDARLVVFGHVADNNLHIVVNTGVNTLRESKAIAEVVYRAVVARCGSISAEHGIGMEKRAALATHLPAPVLEQMRRLKALMDPQGLLNPGKVLEPTGMTMEPHLSP